MQPHQKLVLVILIALKQGMLVMLDRELLLIYFYQNLCNSIELRDCNAVKNRIASKNTNASGFTLIELLVVILIIGILSAIALPTFLRLIGKAKESEATQYISYLNKHQTAQYLEATGFTNSFGTLSFTQQQTATPAAAILTTLGFSLRESKNYVYGIKVAAYNNYPLAVQVALAKDLGTQSFFGIVYAKDGNILVPCGPVGVDVSLSSPVFKQLQVLTKLLSTPQSYCPQLF